MVCGCNLYLMLYRLFQQSFHLRWKLLVFRPSPFLWFQAWRKTGLVYQSTITHWQGKTLHRFLFHLSPGEKSKSTIVILCINTLIAVDYYGRCNQSKWEAGLWSYEACYILLSVYGFKYVPTKEAISNV